MANKQEMAMILSLLEASPPANMSGMTSVLSGASMAQDEQELVDEIPGQQMYANQNETEEGKAGISALELRLTARYLELVGGSERAKEIIDKVLDCQKCLDVDDQIEKMDSDRIDALASMIPSEADLPTERQPGSFVTASKFANLYNPSAGMGGGY